MKTKLIILSLLILGSCKSPKLAVSPKLDIVSEVSVVSSDHKQVYFKKSEHGIYMYNIWMTGIYGDSTRVILLDKPDFAMLVKKVKKDAKF